MSCAQIRSATPDDSDAIARVVRRAFAAHPRSRGNEAAIIAQLRDANALTVSLVGMLNGVVCGYIATSPVKLADGTSGWFALGPVAVDPGAQGHGIGSQLITGCLAELRKLAALGCVVVGAPSYYHRFGFRRFADLTYSDVLAENFMALPFGDQISRGEVTYHTAFSSDA